MSDNYRREIFSMIKTPSYLNFVLTAAAIIAILFHLNIILGPTIGGDTEWYIAAANGHLNEIIEPYSGRFFHPFLVGYIASNFSITIEHGFLIISIASVFLFFLINTLLLKKVLHSSLLLFPLFLSPYFFNTLREIFEPDAFYIFLSALFFLFLFYKMERIGLFTIFFLFLTRETTAILGIMYAGMVWLLSKKKILAITIIAIMGVSFYLTGIMKSIGRPNIHNLSGSTYMVSKLSYNFLTNVAGMRLWINTTNICEPTFKLSLPANKSLGNVREIGFCDFDLSLPLKAFITLFSIFGVAPLIVFYVFLKKRNEIFKNFSFGFLLILGYGLAHYFIGIFAGTGIGRIVGYSWPMFLIAGPVFLSIFFETDRKFIFKLSLVQLLAVWLPFIVYKINGDGMSSLILIILAISTAYFYSFKMIKKQELKGNIDAGKLPTIFKNQESLLSN